jgi:hypothetical protein
MRRYGKSGESGLLMTVLSKHCKDCQPKRTPITELPLHELKRIKAEGAAFHRVSEYKLDALIEKAKAKDVTANQSRSLKLRQQHASDFYAEILKTVDAHIARLRPRATATKQSDEKREYFKLALEYAKRTRVFIKSDIRAGTYPKGKPRLTRLEQLLKPHELRELSDAYERISEQERQRMRRSAFE